MNIGHRGASLHAPENTLASFDLALSLGAHYLELDVHTTKDGHLVVFHDEDLDRVVRAPARAMGGLVSALTLGELSDLDVGSWFSEIYAGTKMAHARRGPGPLPALCPALHRAQRPII